MNNQQKNISRWPKRWREMLEEQPWSAPPVERVESEGLQYLLMLQWSMGNGQCPKCEGVSPLWAGDFRYPEVENYESLHPFTDGNGRSGRALWLWMMKGNAPLGFLHTFYYQTLSAEGNRT